MNPNNPPTVAKKKKKHAVRAIWRFGAKRKNAVFFRRDMSFFLIAPKRQIARTACFFSFFLATVAGLLGFINKMSPQISASNSSIYSSENGLPSARTAGWTSLYTFWIRLQYWFSHIQLYNITTVEMISSPPYFRVHPLLHLWGKGVVWAVRNLHRGWTDSTSVNTGPRDMVNVRKLWSIKY